MEGLRCWINKRAVESPAVKYTVNQSILRNSYSNKTNGCSCNSELEIGFSGSIPKEQHGDPTAPGRRNSLKPSSTTPPVLIKMKLLLYRVVSGVLAIWKWLGGLFLGTPILINRNRSNRPALHIWLSKKGNPCQGQGCNLKKRRLRWSANINVLAFTLSVPILTVDSCSGIFLLYSRYVFIVALSATQCFTGRNDFQGPSLHVTIRKNHLLTLGLNRHTVSPALPPSFPHACSPMECKG